MPRHVRAIGQLELDKASSSKPSRGQGASLVDQLFDRIVEGIREASLDVGARLPPVRSVARDLEVSVDTASRAYDKLVAHGHVEARPGSGFYVKAGQRPPATHGLGRPPDADRLKKISWRQRIVRTAGGGPHPGSGVLPDDWLGSAELGVAIRAAGRSTNPLSGYGDPQGYLPLRQQLELKMAEIAVEASADNILLTNGAAQALALILRAYSAGHGRRILVEDPCPYFLLDILGSLGVDPLLVPRLPDGPDVQELRRLCETHDCSMFICSSALHNPTSSNLSTYRAHQVLRVADEFDLTILEDDTYGDLLPTSGAGATTRLAALDQLERVIYVGSFSKTLAPGLRVGFIAASEERITRCMLFKHVACIASSQLAEKVVYQLLTHGRYRHHCEKLRLLLDERRDRLVKQLISHRFTVPFKPLSGMFVWADLGAGVDAALMAARMAERDVLLAPGAMFCVTMPGALNSFMRFNVATSVGHPALAFLAREVAAGAGDAGPAA